MIWVQRRVFKIKRNKTQIRISFDYLTMLRYNCHQKTLEKSKNRLSIGGIYLHAITKGQINQHAECKNLLKLNKKNKYNPKMDKRNSQIRKY